MAAPDPESIVREVLVAFNAGDVEGLVARCHADVLIVEDPSFPDARTYRGHEGVREMSARWSEAWANVRSTIEELETDGDTVRIITRFTGEGASTGIPVEIERFAVTYRVRDGKVAELRLGQAA
jgi:ketosteroid isomerase-like protein